jgi:hypothetical protein
MAEEKVYAHMAWYDRLGNNEAVCQCNAPDSTWFPFLRLGSTACGSIVVKSSAEITTTADRLMRFEQCFNVLCANDKQVQIPIHVPCSEGAIVVRKPHPNQTQ